MENTMVSRKPASKHFPSLEIVRHLDVCIYEVGEASEFFLFSWENTEMSFASTSLKLRLRKVKFLYTVKQEIVFFGLKPCYDFNHSFPRRQGVWEFDTWAFSGWLINIYGVNEWTAQQGRYNELSSFYNRRKWSIERLPFPRTCS